MSKRRADYPSPGDFLTLRFCTFRGLPGVRCRGGPDELLWGSVLVEMSVGAGWVAVIGVSQGSRSKRILDAESSPSAGMSIPGSLFEQVQLDLGKIGRTFHDGLQVSYRQLNMSDPDLA